MVGVGVGQQHMMHVLWPHAGGAQVAQHLPQAGAEAAGGAGIDQHQLAGRLLQVGVDRRLDALRRVRHMRCAQPAFGAGKVDVLQLPGRQEGHAVE